MRGKVEKSLLLLREADVWLRLEDFFSTPTIE
jgi:hypothetical protein